MPFLPTRVQQGASDSLTPTHNLGFPRTASTGSDGASSYPYRCTRSDSLVTYFIALQKKILVGTGDVQPTPPDSELLTPRVYVCTTVEPPPSPPKDGALIVGTPFHGCPYCRLCATCPRCAPTDSLGRDESYAVRRGKQPTRPHAQGKANPI